MKERVKTIDFLRAFSILAVMVIHTLSFSLSNPYVLFVWNFLQFVVATFIFCSGFVHEHYGEKLVSLKAVLPWYKKRIIRILLPFYIYFALHYVLFLLFPTTFIHFGLQKNLWYFLGSVFLYGGINTNWLPTLFLELTLLTPFLFFLYRKKSLWIYVVCSLLIVVIGTQWPFPYSVYKILMIFPWSLVFLCGLFSTILLKKKKIFWTITLVSGGIFYMLFIIWPHLHRSFNFTDNKYPPNLYYLSYATSLTLLAFSLSKKLVAYVPQAIFEYISQASYSLFFIHFLVLDVVLTFWVKKVSLVNTFGEIVVVIFASLLIQKILDNANSALRKKKG